MRMDLYMHTCIVIQCLRLLYTSPGTAKERFLGSSGLTCKYSFRGQRLFQ